MKLSSLLSLKKKANIEMDLATSFAEIYENSQIEDNLVLYECRDGKSMTDSPLAIFKYLLKDEIGENLKHIWIYDGNVSDWDKIIDKYKNNSNVFFVERNSQQYLYYLTTAKYLINNSTFQSFFIPKNEQVVINTWHGIPLKKMGYDIETGNPAGLQNVIRNFLFTDILVSPNNHTTKMFTNSFKLQDAYEGRILESGYPRIDLTLNINREQVFKELVFQGITIDTDKKVILYCPTWKGTNVHHPVVSQIEQIIAESNFLREGISEEYNVLIKVHPFIYREASKYEELKAYLVPDYFDPNELMSAVDLLITDYSSIFFDFLQTNRPIIFYCWDKELYENNRGLYISEEDLPGPVLNTIVEVLIQIKNLKNMQLEYSKKYIEAKNSFLPYEDGNSTKRLVEYIFQQKEPEKGEIVTCYNQNKIKLLFYTGGMKNNGITSSMINLLKNMDYTKYDVTCFTGFPRTQESIKNILSIPKEVRFVYKPGYAILLKSEQKKLNKFNKDCIKNSDLPIPWKGIEREAKRVFSNRNFDIAIDFSGYSFYWAKYIIGSVAKRKICFLHSDMMADKEKVVNGVKVHEKTLSALFINYSKFDRLLAVSPMMAEVNQNNLKNWITKEKIGFSLNTLDMDKLFNKTISYSPKVLEFEEIDIALTPTDTTYDLYHFWDSLNSKQMIFKGEKIRAIVSKSFEGELRYKILVDDIFCGWVKSDEFERKYPQIIKEENVSQFGYVKRNSNRYLWIDLPINNTARMVSKIKDYQYLLVNIDKIVETEDGKLFYHIKRDNINLGWVNSSAISIVKDYITIRKLKNKYSNRYKKETFDNRILETVLERGGVVLKSIPTKDSWNKTIQNKKTVSELENFINKKFKFTMKVLTTDGWYYRIWSSKEYIGWVNERNVEELKEDEILFTEVFRGNIKLNENKLFNSISLSDYTPALKKEYSIISRVTTLKNDLLETADHFYVDSNKVGSIRDLDQRDINGNIVEFNDSSFNIICIGRLSPEKQQKELIEAFHRFNKKHKNSNLYLLGDGILKNELIELVEKLDLTNAVFLLGHQENPYEILRQCQLLALTSAYEGQPMVLLEAMAVGVPVVATNIPATQYVLQNGKHGLLAEDNSVEGIAKMLEEAYSKKLAPADFNAHKYNSVAIQMFYDGIKGDVK